MRFRVLFAAVVLAALVPLAEHPKPAQAAACTQQTVWTTSQVMTAALLNADPTYLYGTCLNNLDKTNIGSVGLIPSELKPTNTTDATVGGTVPIIFPNGITTTATASGATVAQSLPAFFAKSYHLQDFGGACNGNDVTSETVNGTAGVNVLQGAINAAAGVANLVIDPGSGLCMYGASGADVIVPSNSRIIIDGNFEQAASTAVNFLHIQGGASNIVITGFGTINGNGANETSSATSNLGVTVQTNASNVWLQGLTFVNTRNSAFALSGCANCYVSNVNVNYTTSGLGHANTFQMGSNNCWADNVHINNVGIDGGFAFYGGVYNCGISNSISSNNAVTGFGIDDDTANSTSELSSHDLTFENDIAYSNASYGFLSGAVVGAAAEAHVNFVGDECHGNSYGCIQLQAGTGYNIVALKAHDDLGPSATYGINISSTEQTVSYVNISGCQISNEGIGGTAGIGINLVSTGGAAPSNHVNISGCQIYDDGLESGAPVMKYGIAGGFGAGSGMSNNTITGMATAPLNVGVLSDTQEFQYNGASYMTNQQILSTQGFIAGATLTTGNVYGANDILMQQGNPINFAYSGTPTWSMYQDGSGNLQFGPLGTSGTGTLTLHTNGLGNTSTFTVDPLGDVLANGYLNLGSSTQGVIKVNGTIQFSTVSGSYSMFLANSGNGGSFTGSNVYGLGSTACASMTSQTNSICIGNAALNAAVSVSGDVAVGNNALKNVTVASETGVGDSACANITTGSTDTCLGASAGRYITGGSTSNTVSYSSTYLGAASRPNADGDHDEVVLCGATCTGSGSNTFTVGEGASFKSMYVGGSGSSANGGIEWVSGALSGACTGLPIGMVAIRTDTGAAAGSEVYVCRNVSGTGTWEAVSGG